MAERETERRLRRSNDPITALHYQLAHARHAAGLSAMVLVDSAGALVAGAGAWPVCEELAAFAPLLAHDEDLLRAEAASAAASLRDDVTLRAMSLHGEEVLLAARGKAGAALDASLTRAVSGCLRILGAPRRAAAAE